MASKTSLKNNLKTKLAIDLFGTLKNIQKPRLDVKLHILNNQILSVFRPTCRTDHRTIYHQATQHIVSTLSQCKGYFHPLEPFLF